MIPISVVRFTDDAPCILQATPAAWGLLAIEAKRDTSPALRDAMAQIGAQRRGQEGVQRVTLAPKVARLVLDAAGVG